MTAVASPGNYTLEHLTVFDRPKPKPMPAPGDNDWLSPDVDLEEADIYSEHLADLRGWYDLPVPCLHDETEEDRCARTSNTDNIISPDDRMAEASGGESSADGIITPNMMKPNQTTFKNDQPKAQKVQFWPYPYVRYSNACSAGCFTGWTGLAGNPCQCVFWNFYGPYTVWGFYL